MARIQTYGIDPVIEGSDKLVGTDGSAGAGLNNTKNFTISGISAFVLNEALATFVTLATNQTITGVKTFTAQIIGSISGNAATATILQTPRTIGGVSFDGSANINLPGVNIAGNQDTSGNAATVSTSFITTNADFYLTFVDANNGSPTAEAVRTIGSVKVNPSTGNLSAATFTGAGTGLTGTATSLNIGGNAATATLANLATLATLATTVTTNANLTGVVTSSGNATSIADGALSIAKTNGLQLQLDSRVPYTGATTNVNLGTRSLTTTNLTATGSITASSGPISGNAITGTQNNTDVDSAAVSGYGRVGVRGIGEFGVEGTAYSDAGYGGAFYGGYGTGTGVLVRSLNGLALDVYSDDTGELARFTGVVANKIVTISNNADIVTTGKITSTSFVKEGGAANDLLAADGEVISAGTNILISGGTISSTAVGTVSNVAALTLGNSGTDLSSTVANGTTTPIITLNVPTASATNRGALNNTDWNTFNGKFNLPSLASGSVLFSNGTTIAQDNAQLFWDDTNNRLGIGAQPTAKLSVNVSTSSDGIEVVRAGVSRVLLSGDGIVAWGQSANYGKLTWDTNKAIIQATSGVALSLAAGGEVDHIHINTAGNVGIGSVELGIPIDGAQPRLLVASGGTTGGVLDLRNTSGSITSTSILGKIQFTGKDDQSVGYTNAVIDCVPFSSASSGNSGGGILRFSTAASSTGAAPAQRMIIDSVGNVLIGTTTTASLIQGISGKLVVSDTTPQNISIRNTGSLTIGTKVGGLVFQGAGTTAGAPLFNWAAVEAFCTSGPFGNDPQGGELRFSTVGTGTLAVFSPRMIINKDGAVGINTSFIVGSALLEVASTTKGFLPPRMTQEQKNAIASPTPGLIVYDTTLNKLCVRVAADWTSLTPFTTPAVFLPTIVIGQQRWTRENLDVVTYKNGDIIPQVQDNATWAGLTTGAWCYYNNDVSNASSYGKLYNWHAINDPRGLAPQGWHVPTLVELNVLALAFEPKKLMATGNNSGWATLGYPTNDTGFTAFASGYRETSGTMSTPGVNAVFWASDQIGTQGGARWLNNNSDSYSGFSLDQKFGASVRLIRD